MNNIFSDPGIQKKITTLTAVSKEIIKEKFYEIKNITDFVDVEVGNRPYMQDVVQFAVATVGGKFEEGVINSGTDNSRKASIDVVVGSQTRHRMDWAKKITYNIFDFKRYSESDLVDLVEEKERALKRHYDLGIQKMIFLGSETNPQITGLLNNPNATVNNTVITKFLSSMSEAEMSAFIQILLNTYMANNNNSAVFNRLVIPTEDYNGLSVPYSSYNNGSKKDVIEKAFRDVLSGYGAGDFKILPVAYANAKNVGDNYIYALYNKDERNIVYDLPVEYTDLGWQPFDNFDFNKVVYSQLGSVVAKRPQELMYFTFTK